MTKTNREKEWAHFRIKHDLRIADFYDLVRAGGVVLGNGSIRSIMTGKIEVVTNRKGVTYDFVRLKNAAVRAMEGQAKADATRKKGTRVCRLKAREDDSGTRYGTIPRENIKQVVDALLKGNVRLYTINVRDAEILYCGEPT